jgi:hypothetical protein
MRLGASTWAGLLAIITAVGCGPETGTASNLSVVSNGPATLTFVAGQKTELSVKVVDLQGNAKQNVTVVVTASASFCKLGDNGADLVTLKTAKDGTATTSTTPGRFSGAYCSFTATTPGGVAESAMTSFGGYIRYARKTLHRVDVTLPTLTGTLTQPPALNFTNLPASNLPALDDKHAYFVYLGTFNADGTLTTAAYAGKISGTPLAYQGVPTSLGATTGYNAIGLLLHEINYTPSTSAAFSVYPQLFGAFSALAGAGSVSFTMTLPTLGPYIPVVPTLPASARGVLSVTSSYSYLGMANDAISGHLYDLPIISTGAFRYSLNRSDGTNTYVVDTLTASSFNETGYANVSGSLPVKEYATDSGVDDRLAEFGRLWVTLEFQSYPNGLPPSPTPSNLVLLDSGDADWTF